jgi:predicted amidohydrolase
MESGIAPAEPGACPKVGDFPQEPGVNPQMRISGGSSMRVGFLQFFPKFALAEEDKAKNIDKIKGFLQGAKADLVVLPELFATGYLFESREELVGLAEDADGPTVRALKSLSLEFNTAIVGTVAERSGDAVYNTCYAVSAGEIAGKYRKVHLFDREKHLFAPGDLPFPVVDIRGARIGLMVCFDWIFPEVARVLALGGAQILCHPSNLVLPFCPPAMVTRCIENRVFAITANRVGMERTGNTELEFIGMSEVVAPNGDIMARAGREEELLQIVDIDPATADEKMVTSTNDVMGDRKPEFYRKLCE